VQSGQSDPKSAVVVADASLWLFYDDEK
jgi:hypothetical protein